MRRWTALLALAATLAVAACGWDGPATGVQVVPSPSLIPGVDLEPGTGADVALEPSNDPSSSPPASPSAPDGAEPTTDAAEPSTSSVTSTTTIVPRADPDDLPRTVAVVGDSLTLSATEEIRRVLESMGIDVLAIDGVESRRMTVGSVDSIPPGVDAITQIATGAAPDLWVIALGTNDVGAGSSAGEIQTDMIRVLNLIPEDVPLVWVDFYIRDKREQILDANRELRELLALRPHSIVADWYSHGDEFGIVTLDGVHLTSDGRHVFANAIQEAVNALFA